MGHLLPYPLPWGHGSVGYFADQASDRLIIFVHGFGGKAIKTWSGMDGLLQEPGAQAADVVFYGYGSLAAPARNSAALFLKLMAAAAEGSRAWSNALFRAGAPGRRDYRDILIVAHSLGAVVVRRAVLDAAEDGAEWADRVRFVLFGPAHMGTRVTELKAMLRSGVGSILSDIFTFAQLKMPVLDDLAAGSDFLGELLADSNAAVTRGATSVVKAEGVIFGEKDNIAITKRFCIDPRSDVWDGEDHCSVCRAPQTVYKVAGYL